MVDSVMMVSVIVSIATSPITGVASLIRTKSISRSVRLADLISDLRASMRPTIFSRVPLMPVVLAIAEDRNFTSPLLCTSAKAASVVEFPISMPTIRFIMTSPIG